MMTSIKPVFRSGRLNDLQEMQQLFVGTIEAICSSDYNPEQIRAWTSGIENEWRWRELLTHQFVLVALIGECIVGFGSLAKGGCIDMLYVHKNFQGKGIATAIMKLLEDEASHLNYVKLFSDVSITAKGFFERSGFKAINEQLTIRQGIQLMNYNMVKVLSGRR
jgi:putative acetyltransferase